MRNLIFMALLASFASASGMAAPIRVTVTNLAPANGTFLTPVWVGFHDGTFDLYDSGAPASTELERIAEDGDTAPLSAAFGASGTGSLDGTLGGMPFGPGSSVSMLFTLDSMSEMSRYFSYASMVVPSNDAFIANGNPLAFQIFSAGGTFMSADFIVLGAMVNDAGTEVNDEIPENTAFLAQTVPNTGVTENGMVSAHPGFIPGGNILSDAKFAAADFTVPGYQMARIQVELVPEPATFVLTGLGTVGLLACWRRKRSGERS